MKNGAVYEKKAKQAFSRRYDFPLICGHELFSELNSVQRGASTLLNAKLLPVIREFLAAVKASLKARGVDAPLVIVRSDSSLMSEEFSMLRPVETILCGPAASVLGGLKLTGEKDSVIIDMGGTTTVSYTHLDVDKRQISSTTPIAITPVIDIVLIRFERLRDLKKIPSVMT